MRSGVQQLSAGAAARCWRWERGAAQAPSSAERYHHLLSDRVCQSRSVWLTVPERTCPSYSVGKGAEDQSWTRGPVCKNALKCSFTSLSHHEWPPCPGCCGCFATDEDFFFHYYFDALLWMNMFIPGLWCSAWGKWLIQRCALLSPAPQIEMLFNVCTASDILLPHWGCCYCFHQLKMMDGSAATDFRNSVILPGTIRLQAHHQSSQLVLMEDYKKAACIENMGPRLIASYECKPGFSRKSWSSHCCKATWNCRPAAAMVESDVTSPCIMTGIVHKCEIYSGTSLLLAEWLLSHSRAFQVLHIICWRCSTVIIKFKCAAACQVGGYCNLLICNWKQAEILTVLSTAATTWWLTKIA